VGWYQNGNRFACIRGHKRNTTSILHESEIEETVDESNSTVKETPVEFFQASDTSPVKFTRSPIIEVPVNKTEEVVLPPPQKEKPNIEDQEQFESSNDLYAFNVSPLIEESPKNSEGKDSQKQLQSQNSPAVLTQEEPDQVAIRKLETQIASD